MKTSIICTIGPLSWDEDTLKRMVSKGMNIARINASFADHTEIKRVKDLINSIDPTVKVLLDLMGHKIRITKLEDSKYINDGETIIINCDNNSEDITELKVTYSELCNDIKEGDPILIDDGKVELSTEKIEGSKIFAKVIRGGLIKKGKTVNVPKTHLSFDSLTEKDRADLQFGNESNFDYIAGSFIRNAEDVKVIKDNITNGHSQMISKVENQEGVDNFEGILEISDGIMIARGDLGVELPLERIPILQKRFIKSANEAHKFIIVATQMLESMTENSSPTRAEVSDVANAVMDGANATMLSAETSTGKHPVLAVEYMARIISYTESVIYES